MRSVVVAWLVVSSVAHADAFDPFAAPQVPGFAIEKPRLIQTPAEKRVARGRRLRPVGAVLLTLGTLCALGSMVPPLLGKSWGLDGEAITFEEIVISMPLGVVSSVLVGAGMPMFVVGLRDRHAPKVYVDAVSPLGISGRF